jgi:hypothetical protein
MHDDAELLDQVTQNIMENRRTRTLRLTQDATSGEGQGEGHL